jgi:hypothetical protein
LGAAVVAVNHSRSQPTQVADPLSDERASAEVVDAAVEITRRAGLRDPAGGYAFRSCNNAHDPPFQATVHMTFSLPQGNSVGYLTDVGSAMADLGWTEAATAAEHFGSKLTRSGMTAVFYRNPERTDLATMRIYGECRVMAQYRNDDPAWTELTDRLRRPG